MTVAQALSFKADKKYLILTAGFMWMAGWRCLNCGHIYDPVIERNRQRPQPVVQTVPDEQPVQQHEDVLDEVFMESDSYIDHAA